MEHLIKIILIALGLIKLYLYFQSKKANVEREQRVSVLEDEKAVRKRKLLVAEYRMYIKLFLHMMSESIYAPIGAFNTKKKGLEGFLYLTENSNDISSADSVDMMKEEFLKRIDEGLISTFVILYHSSYQQTGIFDAATDKLYPDTVTLLLGDKHKNVYSTGISYSVDGEHLVFECIENFPHQQLEKILKEELQEREYFQHRVALS